jgi:hypothetical protein
MMIQNWQFAKACATTLEIFLAQVGSGHFLLAPSHRQRMVHRRSSEHLRIGDICLVIPLHLRIGKV